ncbi:hypothetical protein BH09ACT5_BH09ACT5_24540 [soil metagenome]
MANDAPIISRRPERILAFMVASAIGLSIICFLAVIIGTALGAREDQLEGVGIWRLVGVLPLIGLPIAAVLLVALIVVSGIRRGRESKDAGK